MPIVGKYFPSQREQEKVFLLLRRHWFTYFGFVFIAFVMSIPLIVLIIYWIISPEAFTGAGGNIAILGGFIYILFVLAVMLYGFIDYYLDVYIITNERIVNVEQNGFFRREISELHLHQIQDVSAKVKGLFPTIMHYGDIFIQTAGERENFVFQSVPNPYRVSKTIVDLHETQLAEREKEIREEVVEDTSNILSNGETKSNSNEEPDSGFTRDSFDMESVNPASFATARKRTKKYLSGEELEVTDIERRAENQIMLENSKHILEKLDQDKATDLSNSAEKEKKVSSDKSDKINEAPAISKQKSIKASNGKDEGEMHEGEEIDI